MFEGTEGIRGSIPPLITPFIKNEVDYASYAELVNFHLAEGSHGILVNGTTAEPSTLSVEERNNIGIFIVDQNTFPVMHLKTLYFRKA